MVMGSHGDSAGMDIAWRLLHSGDEPGQSRTVGGAGCTVGGAGCDDALGGRGGTLARGRSGARDGGGPGMRRGRNHRAGGWAVLRVNNVVVDELKWHFGAN